MMKNNYTLIGCFVVILLLHFSLTRIVMGNKKHIKSIPAIDTWCNRLQAFNELAPFHILFGKEIILVHTFIE